MGEDEKMTDAIVQAPGAEPETETVPADEGRPQCFRSTIQECVFVLTTMMAIGQSTFFAGLNTGINAAIAADLHMDSAEIAWISAGCAYVTFPFLDLCFPRIPHSVVPSIFFHGVQDVSQIFSLSLGPNWLWEKPCVFV